MRKHTVIYNSQFFRCRDFPVYKKAREFRKLSKKLSEKFPRNENFVLKQQLWRALDSVLLNIAEGSERYSDLDFSHYLNNSFTSLIEAVSCFDLAFDDNYISQEELKFIIGKGEELGKQLRAFSAYVRPSSKE